MTWLSDAGLWAAINFAILVFLIVKYGGKPIAGVFRARAEEISRAVNAAQTALAEAQRTLDAARELEAQERAILENVAAGARTLATSLAADIDKEAKAEAERVKAAARAEIERERHSLLSELRASLLKDAFAEAERRIRRSLSAEDHRELFDAFAQKAIEVRP
jgi:F-type H+-transporting ATPase subunit b